MLVLLEERKEVETKTNEHVRMRERRENY